MINNLNELEVLKIAQGIEEEGLRFYTEAMKRENNPQLKEIFKMLADEEKMHAELFSNMYKEAREASVKDDEYIFDEATSAYLRALSDTAVFNTNGITNSRLIEVVDTKDALLIGIQAEKDAMLFYTKIYEVSKFETTKEYLKKLIQEESEHLSKLMELYKNL
ncbi:ferritin family protein [Alkalithermobacter paradoxus]|uniref:Putative trifunctional 2-polyprenylphenol hydroxylase domain-containing protein n=1 Tax=Alkalithermobacter paradoxus TaxID=29349 RepID=A0A1V4I6C7_9FIRM|nr:putative trifunctional 2-polyprenylphenol hydroxylase domain-containing protein [[Clostridium] thermoalcaliphilum]